MGDFGYWVAVLILILGILSLLLEILVFPGFGVSGVAGILLMAWGILLLSTDLLQSLQALVIGLIVTIILFILGIRFGHKRKLWHKLSLNDRQAPDQGYSSVRPELQELLHKRGVTVTPLRPAGMVEIDGKRIDMVSEGGYIPPGTTVLVIKVEGPRVVVKPVNQTNKS